LSPWRGATTANQCDQIGRRSTFLGTQNLLILIKGYIAIPCHVGVVYIVVSSMPATEGTGAMGREIESRLGINMEGGCLKMLNVTFWSHWQQVRWSQSVTSILKVPNFIFSRKNLFDALVMGLNPLHVSIHTFNAVV
jgi:hypothetical protein